MVKDQLGAVEQLIYGDRPAGDSARLIATPFTSTMADLKRAVDAVADQKHVEQLKKGVAKWNAWGGVGEIGPAAADRTRVLEQGRGRGRKSASGGLLI